MDGVLGGFAHFKKEIARIRYSRFLCYYGKFGRLGAPSRKSSYPDATLTDVWPAER